MKTIKRRLAAKMVTAALTLLLASCAMPVKQQSVSGMQASCAPGEAMKQTTLYFGLNRHDGAVISASEWQTFIDRDVTPRFKQGLTVFDAKGQWLGEDDNLSRENSKALMLIYAPSKVDESRIEALRSIYKQRFAQQSVMRIDAPVCASF